MQSRHALEGLKIADFSWVITAPLAVAFLAQYGATVVKVESMNNIDVVRPYAPYKDNIPGINRGGLFTWLNNCKYDMALDLRNPKGIEVANRLVKWSDVVVQSYSPGVIERLGLGYEELCKIKPDIIMLSTSMLGQTGPHAHYSAFGTMLQALSGFVNLWGWPDRAPVAPPTAYTDWVAPPFLAIAIIAALEHRLKTGEGQYIDASQYEAGLQFLLPAILDYTANGVVEQRLGNRSPFNAPHGIYRCQGDDRWCAIDVGNEEEWEGFCQAIGNPEWTKEAKCATLIDRLKNTDELDKLVEQWTVNYPPEEVMSKLQAYGVPAMRVANGRDVHEDPQLNQTGHFQLLEHPEMGGTTYEAPAFILHDTPYELKPAPCLGQHTEYVCTKLLGMSDEEFLELDRVGAFI